MTPYSGPTGTGTTVVRVVLGVLERRSTTGTNGASWQAARVLELQAGGMERVAALHRMLREYVANMHSNAPVHTWDK